MHKKTYNAIFKNGFNPVLCSIPKNPQREEMSDIKEASCPIDNRIINKCVQS